MAISLRGFDEEILFVYIFGIKIIYRD